VSSFYDPMLAKLIVHAGTREEAAEGLARDCASALTWPVKTNNYFLARALRDDAFVGGHIDTSFIGNHQSELGEPRAPEEIVLEIGASELMRRAANPGIARRRRGLPNVQFPGVRGLRVNAAAQSTIRAIVDGRIERLPIPSEGHIALNIEYVSDGVIVSNGDGQLIHFSLDQARGTGTSHGVHDGEIEAPMPGRVTAVEVAQGDKVAKGQRLLTLEAMKMEHALTAPFDGTIAELKATAGAQVGEGQMLVRVEPAAQG